MRTLADFKRALTIGSQWYCLHVPTDELLNDGKPRTVHALKNSKVQFGEGERVSNLHFPKSTEIEFRHENGMDYVDIFWPACGILDKERRKILTYWKANSEVTV